VGKKKTPPKPPQQDRQAQGRSALRLVERPSDFRGVEELVFVDPRSLKDKSHPENWKTHTQRQISALDAELDQETGVGWAGAMLYNRRTSATGWPDGEVGILLDGHGRERTEYAQAGKPVPVLIGDWTAEQERRILLHLDPIGAMFETDRRKFNSLMDKHKATMSEMVDKMRADHQESLQGLDRSLIGHIEAQKYDGENGAFLPEYKDYFEPTVNAVSSGKTIFEADEVSGVLDGNRVLKQPGDYKVADWDTGYLQIPNLRPDMLFRPPDDLQVWVGPETPEAEAYYYTYGCAAIEKVRSAKMVVGFYTWDYKFESLWNDPATFCARMLNLNVLGALPPNFSCYGTLPHVTLCWQIYRNRWIGRYWQEQGIKIIPDLQCPTLGDKMEEQIFYTGIPRHAPCLATQLHNQGQEELASFAATMRVSLFAALEALQPQSLLAYCHEKFPDNFFKGIPGNIPVIRVNTWMSERRKAIKGKREYLSKGAAG
jgi:hypothetical protein